MSTETCGYTLTDKHGEQYPCDQPATGRRWYQDCEHEDMLDSACILHENEGGRRMAGLLAKVADLHASLAERDEVVDEYRTHAAAMAARAEAAEQAVQRVRELAADLDREGHEMARQGGILRQGMADSAVDAAARILRVLDGGEPS